MKELKPVTQDAAPGDHGRWQKKPQVGLGPGAASEGSVHRGSHAQGVLCGGCLETLNTLRKELHVAILQWDPNILWQVLTIGGRERKEGGRRGGRGGRQWR